MINGLFALYINIYKEKRMPKKIEKKKMPKKLKETKETLPAVSTTQVDAGVVSDIVLKGDLRQFTPEQKVKYYTGLCKSLGLNPLTKPFDLLILNNREVLYANKGCSEQLRQKYKVSVENIEQKIEDGICITTVLVKDHTGRVDGEIGAVNVAGLRGDALANARMKSATKAKRRATLSICGLGFLDETEVETIPGAQTAEINISNGLIEQKESPRPQEHPAEISIAELDKAYQEIKSLLMNATNMKALVSIIEQKKSIIGQMLSEMQQDLRSIYKKKMDDLKGEKS